VRWSLLAPMPMRASEARRPLSTGRIDDETALASATMLTVAGEALMDLIADASGALVPRPGGGAFNVARFAAQLGVPCTYLGPLSRDSFGDLLRTALLDAGVTLAVPEPTDVPTTLALARLDESGAADYRFYVHATAAAQLDHADVRDGLLASSRALVLGGIVMAVDPARQALLALADSAPENLVVLLDPNCRPDVITDISEYRETVASIQRRADVLKLSAEDIAVLAPGCDPQEYALDALAHGPSVVIVTDGAGDLLLARADGVRRLPVPETEVVDTIGAGDAFVAGFLRWLLSNAAIDLPEITLDELQDGVESAMRVAAAVCSMRGATLPIDG